MGIVIFFFLASGCSFQNSTAVKSPARDSEGFSFSGSDTFVPRWWTEFDDPILDYLTESSLRDNLSLKQSWNRLAEAKAQLRGQTSGLYPSLDVTADYRDQKRRQAGATEITQSTGLALSASYEVDLWGKIESSVEAARYETRASREDLMSAAMSLSSEVTLTWFQLVEAYAQKYILEDQIETNKKILNLIEKRFRYGKVRAADVLRQRRLYDSTLGQKENIIISIKVLEHKLAVLLGKIPDRMVNPVRISLPESPPVPATGIPARVINRRPDVRAAFLRLKSADKEVAGAIARRYPRISIAASLSTEGANAGDLFDDWLQSIAADFALPLFDGGSRRADVSRAKAVLARRVNGYKETVLGAYREIEDALVREKQQKKQLVFIKKQLKSATQTVERIRSQYLNGTTDYLDVLNALESKQQLQRNLMTAKEKLLEYRVALYRSLAGGFEIDNRLVESY